MHAGVDILLSEYDSTHSFVVIKKNGENIYAELGICQFVEDMAYLVIFLNEAVVNGEAGYVISKEIDFEEIKMEIKRFIVHNDI